ncbi:MAG: LytTR family DNA-binding domain-containing protein [Bacteroidales bacterium]|nr:LytTR family DNA-binding domain-containing protein [Bacteroidales bacterium]
MAMNCIIIDDDKMSRKILEEYIQRTDSLKLLHSYANAIDAINQMHTLPEPVHLIFLDIEMPEMNGIDFLNTLKQTNSQIIIVSAKDKYAVTAFEYDVTDYLLKPFNYARFYKSVDRAFKKIDNFMSVKSLNNENTTSEEIFIKKNATLLKLNFNDILFIEALENYIIINTFDEKYTIHFTMKAIEEKLPPNKFKRIHRSYIINLNKIKGIEENSVLIKTNEGTKLLPIGKSYKEDLIKTLNVILK